MRRRRGGQAVAVLAVAVAMVSVTAVAVPAGAQAEEPGVEVVVTQEPNLLSLGAAGCYFSPGSPVQITFSGGGGRSQEFSRHGDGNGCFAWSPDDLDPCRLGGSDLPGAQYTVTFEVEADGYSLDQLITLTPDTTKPRFLDPAFDASPRAGSSVKVGDEINFEVTATDKTPAPSWQTGVHSLQVTGPEGLVGEPQDGGRVPKACGEKSKSLTVRGSHRVRRSDPAVIELCAITEDYVPNENTKCAQWYKGEVWEGTMNHSVTTPVAGPCGNPVQIQGTAVFVVEANGKVTGSYDVTGCGVSEPHADFTGTATDESFSLPQLIVQTNGESIPKVSDRRARATLTNQQGPATWVTEWDLKCVEGCDEAVG